VEEKKIMTDLPYSFKELQYIVEQDRKFSNPKKDDVRKLIINKYILPKFKKGKEVNVVDFFGTGKFVEAVRKVLSDHTDYVNNQPLCVSTRF
jgi:hypothetical protein